MRNSDFLAKKGKKKSVKVSKPVVFDEKAREEFLTGFRKRKLEKKKNAKEKFDKLVKQEKAEKRKEKRRQLKTVLDSMLEKMGEEKEIMDTFNIEPSVTEYVDEASRTTVVAEPLEL